MFNKSMLEAIRVEGLKSINHHDALPKATYLKEGRYEVMALESIEDRTFIYKAYDAEKSMYVSIKEFFPRKAFGINTLVFLTRSMHTLDVVTKESSDEKRNEMSMYIEQFMEEAKYLEKIAYGDPLIRIIDAFEDHQTAYIVSKYNPWPSLQDILNSNHVFTMDEIHWLMDKIVNQVVRFHKRQVVHRHITPKNIYVKSDDVIIDSIGSCDIMQEFKIAELDPYQSKYLAPEIMLGTGETGTWTDVYAMCKVMVEIIAHASVAHSYFAGLETLPEPNRNIYRDIIKKGLAFNFNERIQTAVEFKKLIVDIKDSEKSFKTPKSIFATIASIAVIGISLFIWQNNDGYINESLLNEPVPLGAVDVIDQAFGFDVNQSSFTRGAILKVSWQVHEEWKPDRLLVYVNNSEVLKFDLEATQEGLDLTEFELPEGEYTLKLYYRFMEEEKFDTMNLEVIE